MHALPYWRLSGYYFFYFAFVGAFSPYFGLYLQGLGFSAWDIGVLMSQMQLMRLFAPNLWGWLADRLGRRVAIVRLAGGISLAGFTAFFWLRDMQGMLLAMTVLAFFWSASLPLVETLTFDHLREVKERYSRIRLWGSIGFIVAVMATGALLDWVPPSGVLWVCWGILAGIFLLACLVPEPQPVLHHQNVATITNILRQPKVRALLVASFLMSAAHGALYIFYSMHLADHGYSKTAVGSLWSLGVVAEILVFWWMSRISRRYSLRAILAVCFAAAILRFGIIGWMVDSVPLAIFAQLLHGLTFGACHAASVDAISRWFKGKAHSRGQALYSSISFGAGGLLGGLVGGWSWDAIGADWTYTLSSFFSFLGLLAILGWVRGEPAQGAPNH